MEKNSAAENKVVKKGKIPENITTNGNTVSSTLSVKLTAEENIRFTVDLERSGMSNKTDYVKQRLFKDKPIITLDKGREIFGKLSECVELLHALNESNSVVCKQDVLEITNRLGEIEADFASICDYIDVVNNERKADQYGDSEKY